MEYWVMTESIRLLIFIVMGDETRNISNYEISTKKGEVFKEHWACIHSTFPIKDQEKGRLSEFELEKTSPSPSVDFVLMTTTSLEQMSHEVKLMRLQPKQSILQID